MPYEAFSDEKVVSLSQEDWVFYAIMWAVCDDAGRVPMPLLESVGAKMASIDWPTEPSLDSVVPCLVKAGFLHSAKAKKWGWLVKPSTRWAGTPHGGLS